MSPRVWAEVDLAAVRHNLKEIRAHVGLRVAVMPVVKADAYGHGAAEVARAATMAGCDWLGVATVAEGADLRQRVPGASIALLAPFLPDEAEEIVRLRLTPLVSDLDGARALALAGQRGRTAARVHLEVDTGMGRSGALPGDVARLATHLGRMGSIVATGIATHFPCAETDPEATRRQLATLLKATAEVRATDTTLQLVHCASSAALLLYPESRLDMVRPGLLVYGIVPPVPPAVPVPPVRRALTLKTRIVLVRQLPVGATVSYGATRILDRPTRVATLPVGYGDGYPRALGNVGRVLVGGRSAPILGRICMDMTLADVTDIPGAEVGSEVVLIGTQGEAAIGVEEIARTTDTTEHDVTTRLTPRVPRRYLGAS